MICTSAKVLSRKETPCLSKRQPPPNFLLQTPGLSSGCKRAESMRNFACVPWQCRFTSPSRSYSAMLLRVCARAGLTRKPFMACQLFSIKLAGTVYPAASKAHTNQPQGRGSSAPCFGTSPANSVSSAAMSK